MTSTLRRAALLGALFFATLAPASRAQDLPDAALPDASVGEGGAGQSSEENDTGSPCLDARDCTGGFTCDQGRCVPGTVKKVGCGGTAALGTLVLGAGLLLTRRRRSRARTRPS